jgi:hypothetical protein
LDKQADPHLYFLELYKDLYDHADYLEGALEKLIRRQKVDRGQLDEHLNQILVTLSESQKSHATLRFTRKGKKTHPNPFQNQMVKVTRVVREQATVLLETSFLLDRDDPGLEYIQTLSDVHENIMDAFQHVLRSNVLMPVVLN